MAYIVMARLADAGKVRHAHRGWQDCVIEATFLPYTVMAYIVMAGLCHRSYFPAVYSYGLHRYGRIVSSKLLSCRI